MFRVVCVVAVAFWSAAAHAHNVTAGINIDPVNPSGYPTAQELAELGARWARVEFKVLTTLDAAFVTYNGVVQRYVEDPAEIKVLFILDYTTLPGQPDVTAPASAWENYTESFAQRCQVIAHNFSKYGTNIAFEVWNEPDYTSSTPAYHPTVPGEAYGKMLKLTYQKIKATSNATVVMGGLCSGDPSYLSQVDAHGQGLWVDAIGLHPYGRRPDQSWPSASWGFGTLSDLVGSYRTEIAKLTPCAVPLWLTEYGDADVNSQGLFPQHAFDSINSAQQGTEVPLLFWFCYSDGMVTPFGLVDKNGSPKPSYASFQAYALHHLDMSTL